VGVKVPGKLSDFRKRAVVNCGAGADLKHDNVFASLLRVHRVHPLLNSGKSQRRRRKGVCHGRPTMLKNNLVCEGIQRFTQVGSDT
jgi:hypothetical protein